MEKEEFDVLTAEVEKILIGLETSKIWKKECVERDIRAMNFKLIVSLLRFEKKLKEFEHLYDPQIITNFGLLCGMYPAKTLFAALPHRVYFTTEDVRRICEEFGFRYLEKKKIKEEIEKRIKESKKLKANTKFAYERIIKGMGFPPC